MNYFEMWKAAWNFQKKYAEIKNDDEYWESVVNESSEICKQYENCRFIRDLILAVVTEFERMVKMDAETHKGI